MKAVAIFFAIAGTLGLSEPVVAQAQSITLEGTVDLSMRSSRNSAGSLQSVASGGNATSVLRFRGEEDLGGGMKAGFWLESTIAADTGAIGAAAPAGQFFDRQSTVRLSGSWGEIRMGRDWTPMFLAYVATDAMGYVGVGAAGSLGSAPSSTAIRRAFGKTPNNLTRSSNAIEYILPSKLGGFYGHMMTSFGENSNTSGAYKFSGGRFGYAGGGMDISAFAGSTGIDAQNANFRQSGLSGSYVFSNTKLMASVTDSRFLDSKQRTYILGARVALGSDELRISYVKADQSGRDAQGSSIDRDDAQLFALGYVHNLSKRTALYANAARIRNNGSAAFSVPGGPTGIKGGTGSTGYEAGIRHRF